MTKIIKFPRPKQAKSEKPSTAIKRQPELHAVKCDCGTEYLLPTSSRRFPQILYCRKCSSGAWIVRCTITDILNPSSKKVSFKLAGKFFLPQSAFDEMEKREQK